MSTYFFVALAIIALAVFAFVFSGRVGAGDGLEAAAWPLFAILTALALSSLFLPSAYDPVASGVLHVAGVDDRLHAVDEAISETLRLDDLAAIETKSRDLLGRLRGFISRGAEAEPAPGSADGTVDLETGKPGSTTTGGETATGLVEAAVMPMLVNLLALALRAGALAGSLIGLLALVALRIAARATQATGKSRSRVDALEARVAELEQRLERESGSRLSE